MVMDNSSSSNNNAAATASRNNTSEMASNRHHHHQQQQHHPQHPVQQQQPQQQQKPAADEPPPSPLSVGKEFVRQYYTLLNRAPLHLHRFYNHDSSFTHGGLAAAGGGGGGNGSGGSSNNGGGEVSCDNPMVVIGQKEIHERIMQLNFRDCHTKIRQVDAQATLDKGVVVQVTGELSNNGQPMRRFMQTFVLAKQTPKKYYVHNDIFRYQDEIFGNEPEQQPQTQAEVPAGPAPQGPPPESGSLPNGQGGGDPNVGGGNNKAAATPTVSIKQDQHQPEEVRQIPQQVH